MYCRWPKILFWKVHQWTTFRFLNNHANDPGNEVGIALGTKSWEQENHGKTTGKRKSGAHDDRS